MMRFDLRAQQKIAWGLLIVAMLVYAVDMNYQAILRYDTFKATAFDLGNMDQVLWNTIHGRPFQFTNQAIDWYGPPTRLAIRFEYLRLPSREFSNATAAIRYSCTHIQTLCLVSHRLHPCCRLQRRGSSEHCSVWPAGYLALQITASGNYFVYRWTDLEFPGLFRDHSILLSGRTILQFLLSLRIIRD